MDRRSEVRNQSITVSAYLAALNVADLRTKETQIIEQILRQLQSRYQNKLPIRLSAIANDFQIWREPEFDPTVRQGRLRFDAERKHFIIVIGGKAAANQALNAPLIDEEEINQLRNRQRFTYAHEFAHRFFFVENGPSIWTRAIERAIANLNTAEATHAYRVLHRLEENMCNTIARSVLLPDEALFRKIPEAWPKSEPVRFKHFLDDLGRCFAVSREVVLVRIQRAVEDELISWPQNFCVFLFEDTDAKGYAERSKTTMRMRESVVPKTLAESSIRRMYPGLAVDNFGPVMSSFVDSCLKSTKSGGGINLEMVFMEDRKIGERKLPMQLTGWWQNLNNVGLRKQHNRILIWGNIERRS